MDRSEKKARDLIRSILEADPRVGEIRVIRSLFVKIDGTVYQVAIERWEGFPEEAQ